ncbi:MAG TPA: transglycosylase SLT domain-containing protein [Acidimicrobiales bacterium]|nr:transglycosylase SLT domain-containing protein [Acidimicrobiales bacterium]
MAWGRAVAGLVLLAGTAPATAALALGTGLGWADVQAVPAGADPPAPAAAGIPTEGPVGAIPPAMLGLYVEAAPGTCAGLPWPVLAAIGTLESDNGTSEAPGVQWGANFAGAEGVMQFEPATFAEYSRPVPAGGADPPSPYDATDSVWAAARLLCADGAGAGDLPAAIYAYNHSAAYVTEVWDLAVAYGMPVTDQSFRGVQPLAWSGWI